MLTMTTDEYKELAEKYELNSSLNGIVNISVNTILAYKNMIRERIDKTKVIDL